MYQGQSRERFENNNGKLAAHRARSVRTQECGPVLRPSLVAVLVSAAVAVMAVSPGEALAQPAASMETRQPFHIAAQPLLEALKAFGRQTQAQVLFDDGLVEGRQGAAVSGNLSAREALARLLAGTGLAAVSTQPGTFTIQTAAAAASKVTLAEVTVTAQADANGATEGTGSYTADRVRTATKLDLSIRETPQSVSVVTQQQMRDANMQSLDDVTDALVGVTYSQLGTERSYFYSRGFQVTDLQIDGLSTSMAESFSADAIDRKSVV